LRRSYDAPLATDFRHAALLGRILDSGEVAVKEFAIKKFDIEKYDSILARGLSSGLGEREAQVCIEAAICEALGLPHGDDPGCVAVAVRSFKITLNDSRWSSEKARAEGLRDLGLAQLGSLGVVNDAEFSKRLAEQTIRVLIPKLFRQIFAGGKNLEAAALRCEKEGTSDAASDAARAASDAASGVTVLLARVPSTLISNINSMLVAGTFALGASNLSDIESRVWSADKSDFNASSQMGSLLNAAGGGADAATIAAKVWSDYQSKVGQSPSQVYSNTSNMLSYISGVVSGLGAGASASAIADKVWSDFG